MQRSLSRHLQITPVIPEEVLRKESWIKCTACPVVLRLSHTAAQSLLNWGIETNMSEVWIYYYYIVIRDVFCTVLLVCEWKRLCVCVAENRRLHSLICSFSFSRCSFAFFLTIRLSQLSNTKALNAEKPFKQLLLWHWFPFSPAGLNCLQMIFFCRFFKNDLLKYGIDFLSQFHRRTLSYPRNNSGGLLSSHSPAFSTYNLL